MTTIPITSHNELPAQYEYYLIVADSPEQAAAEFARRHPDYAPDVYTAGKQYWFVKERNDDRD